MLAAANHHGKYNTKTRDTAWMSFKRVADAAGKPLAGILSLFSNKKVGLSFQALLALNRRVGPMVYSQHTSKLLTESEYSTLPLTHAL